MHQCLLYTVHSAVPAVYPFLLGLSAGNKHMWKAGWQVGLCVLVCDMYARISHSSGRQPYLHHSLKSTAFQFLRRTPLLPKKAIRQVQNGSVS